MPPRSHLCRQILFGPIILALAVTGGCSLRKPKLPPIFRPRADKAKFTDLEDDPIAELVDGLVRLGVIEFSEGMFQPDKSIERGMFIVWLVRANNIFFRNDPKQWIPLAEVGPNAGWAYLDVMPHTTNFGYIQGMINAGRPVGFEKQGGDYGYAKALTRERMILLRTGVCLGADRVLEDEAVLDDYRIELRTYLADADVVTEKYLPAIASDARDGDTIRLAFEDVDLDQRDPKTTLKPKRLVTRREAVLALSKIRERTYKAAQAVGEWPPLTKEEQEELANQLDAERKEARGSEEHAH